MVIDNTAIPESTFSCTLDVVNTLKYVGNRTTRHQGIEDIVLGKVDVARAKPIKEWRQWLGAA